MHLDRDRIGIYVTRLHAYEEQKGEPSKALLTHVITVCQSDSVCRAEKNDRQNNYHML